MYTMKKKHYLHCLLAFLAAALIFIPAFLQVKTNAASTPGTVTLSKISAPAYNKITISWKKIGNATAYNIYYRKHGSSKWTKVASVSSSASSYTHTSSTNRPIVVGQKYDYTVRAYNKKSKKMGKYNTSGLTARTLPEKVKLIDINRNSDDTLTLTWNKSKGCDYYIIYRRPKDKWYRLSKQKVTSSKIQTDDPNVFAFTDPDKNATDLYDYTVRGYYSKTNAYGDYDKLGKNMERSYDDYLRENDFHDDSEKMAAEVFKFTNEARVKNGRAPLKYSKRLEKGAMVRAKEIVQRFDHVRPDGGDIATAYTEAGALGIAAENIAGGYGVAKEVVDGWMDSWGHRHAILLPDHHYFGAGFYQDPKTGTNYWVQAFSTVDPDVGDGTGTVYFYAEGGHFSDGKDVYGITKYGGYKIYMSEAPIPVREGYKFDYWASNYGEKLKAVYAGTETTFHAVWVPE